jgi:hypothetical protein
MWVKIGIIILMLVILCSLFSGLVFLVKDEGKTKRTVNALTVRIACSVGLFLFLFLAFHFHWINPHNLA